jgi:hypothetical protein
MPNPPVNTEAKDALCRLFILPGVTTHAVAAWLIGTHGVRSFRDVPEDQRLTVVAEAMRHFQGQSDGR